MLIDYYIEALLRDPEAADAVWEALDQDQISEYVAAAAWCEVVLNDRYTPESGRSDVKVLNGR